MGKYAENVHQDLVPDPFFMVLTQNSYCMQEIILKIRYFERGLSKTFKKVNFFLLNPVLFNRQSYQKQKGSGASGQSLFSLQNKFTKMSSLVIYYLTKFDSVTGC